MNLPVFKTSITLPDAGLQEREHTDLAEMKQYLVSCVRMDADITSLRVTAPNGQDLTAIVRKEILRHTRE